MGNTLIIFSLKNGVCLYKMDEKAIAIRVWKGIKDWTHNVVNLIPQQKTLETLLVVLEKEVVLSKMSLIIFRNGIDYHGELKAN
jgi:hypothetical protein